MYSDQSLPTSEGELRWARWPLNGPPLVMLHGVLRSGGDFAPVLLSLVDSYQIALLDFRGHGGSARMPGVYRTMDYVGDAVALLRKLAGPAVIWGHSLGAMVAARAAAEVPELVRGLILEDPPFETMGARIGQTAFLGYFSAIRDLLREPRSTDDLAAALAEIRLSTPGSHVVTRLGDVRDAVALQVAASFMQQVDPEVLSPICDGSWLHGYDRASVASAIQCPTLILQADPTAGGMLTDDDARDTAARIADCTLIKLSGAGHLLHWQRTEETLRYVHSFLESLP